MPAQKEYSKHIDDAEAQATFANIDRLVSQNQPVPKTRAESFSVGRLRLWEVKAPRRGEKIGRILCYNPAEWEFYVALCRRKKTNRLPEGWKATAAERVRTSLSQGGP